MDEVCPVCQNLEKCNLILSPQDLRPESNHTCDSCAILKRGISAFINDFEQVDEFQLVIDSSLFVHVVGKEEGKGKGLGTIEFYTVDGEPALISCHFVAINSKAEQSAAASNIGTARHVSDNSSNEECINLAISWLSGCLSTHSSCRRASVSKLPTRVISVGSCEDEVKLETETSNINAEYVALSHVWGRLLPIRLTSATLEELRQKVVFDDASKTLREAVEVTRRLGIPYIWIDSLCIIQEGDGGEDWNKEAPKMSEVYNNATLTISAGVSKSSATGLFPSREDRNSTQKVVTIHEPESDSTVFARFRRGDVFSTTALAHSSTMLEQPHIGSRGWVLQEDLLSPRILQFRKEEMTWSCSTYSKCECRIRPSLPAPHPFRGARGLSPPDPEKSQNLVLQWPSIIMDFTRRDLTQPQDRMMALAGLADYMEDETTDTYYGGLWYEDIAFELLWISDHEESAEKVIRMGSNPVVQKQNRGFLKNIRRLLAKCLKSKPTSTSNVRFPVPYAPSWSWASISGPISYYQRYPVGSAPSHPATKTADAIVPLLRVINLVRFPMKDTVFGPLLFCPLFAIGLVLPIIYDKRTKLWKTEGQIADLDSSILIFHVDVPEEDPTSDEFGNYALILVGEWKGAGLTIVPMQGVCILARQIQVQSFTALVNVAFHRVGLNEEQMPIPPTIDNSYTRVGLVRGAGSVDAWGKSENLVKAFFLF
jgi:hypothetical protein